MAKHKFPYLVNICYIINDKNQVLLQEKARGFGKGKWNGPGGKVEPEESVSDSVRREVKEETGLVLLDLQKMGEIEFIFTTQEENNNYCHIFISRQWHGEAEDKGEGRLKWFAIDDLPLDKMWDDDKYWLPDLLRGKKKHMRFYFDQDDRVIKYKDL